MFHGNLETATLDIKWLPTGYELRSVRLPRGGCDTFPTMPLSKNNSAALRQLLTLLVCAALAWSLAGCAALDPQHVLTRHIGNPAPADGAALDVASRQQAFDFVWGRINEAYVDPYFKGVNWQQVGTDHRDQILTAPNDALFWKRLDIMVAELGDAHTRVLSPRHYTAYKDKQTVTTGLSLARLNSDIVVVAVAKDSAGEKAGIAKGQKLLTIDGLDATDWWQQQTLKARKNSTLRAQFNSVKRSFNRGDPEYPKDNVSVRLERADTTQFDAVLARGVRPYKDALTTQILPSGLGYLRLTGFDLKLLPSVLSAFKKLKDAPALVIDLRGNSGGAVLLATEMMNYLVQGEVVLGKKVTRSGQAPSLFFGLLRLGSMDLKLQGVKAPYLAPVVVLVDSESASSSELFAGSLQSMGRAEIVGETTCGCLLGYLGYANVPGGGALSYSELDMVPALGKRIEGVGVIPDHAVALSRQDLIDGKDRALERAIQVLETRLGR